MENIIFAKGTISYLGYGKTKKDSKDKFRLTLNLTNKADIIGKLQETFSNCPLKPSIVTDNNCNIINVKSLYPFPVQINDSSVEVDIKDTVDCIESFIDYGFTQDSEVTIKLKCKTDGQISAIYPVAMRVNKVGSKYDTFADFE